MVTPEEKYISCCANYYCTACAYHTGTLVSSAKDLLQYAERYGSLRLILESNNACDVDDFMKGLRWIASQETPCKGCRFGGGWSWWPDCPVRECVLSRGLRFCSECLEFPCEKLTEGPHEEWKERMIEANEKLSTLGIKGWLEALKQRYGK